MQEGRKVIELAHNFRTFQLLFPDCNNGIVIKYVLVALLLTVFSISVNPSDATSDKDGDASLMCCDHGGRHRRSSRKPLNQGVKGDGACQTMWYEAGEARQAVWTYTEERQ